MDGVEGPLPALLTVRFSQTLERRELLRPQGVLRLACSFASEGAGSLRMTGLCLYFGAQLGEQMENWFHLELARGC